MWRSVVVSTALFLVACGSATSTPEASPAEPVEAAEPATPAAAPAAAAAEDAAWDVYGEGVNIETVVAAKTVLDDPASFVGTDLVVEGELADVCQKKGCWSVITDGTRSMRVMMKDHAFGIDMQGTGRTGQFQGQVVGKGIDPATVEHFKSESAKPEAMPEAALPADATVTYELVASGVRLRREG